MTTDHLALMAALLAGSIGLAAFFGWRGGNASADVALMGGAGVACGLLAGALAAF